MKTARSVQPLRAAPSNHERDWLSMATTDSTTFTDTKTIERFWAKVQKTDTCWLWTASKRNKGYGAFCWRVNGKLNDGRAHIFSYRLHKGEIPAGLCVLHECDTPACVNPAHLFLGTKQDNVDDMNRKGRGNQGGYKTGTHPLITGDSHWNSKLTAEKAKEIRQLRSEGWTYAKLGEHFGISPVTCWDIIAGKTWRETL